ncbi:hypothetical protein [Spirosoma aerophilum]
MSVSNRTAAVLVLLQFDVVVLLAPGMKQGQTGVGTTGVVGLGVTGTT